MPLQMQKIPDLEKLNIKDILSYGGATQHGEERAKKHDKAASLYNHVSCRLTCPFAFHRVFMSQDTLLWFPKEMGALSDNEKTRVIGLMGTQTSQSSQIANRL